MTDIKAEGGAMVKLNPNAQKWVEALRSGKYKQGCGKLERDGKFCCLGVATDCAINDGLPLTWHGYMNDVPSYRLLPNQVGAWLGLKDDKGDTDWVLAKKNDLGDTFPQIADYIEQHADELFVKEGVQ